MTGEWVRLTEEAVVAYFNVLFRYFPGKKKDKIILLRSLIKASLNIYLFLITDLIFKGEEVKDLEWDSHGLHRSTILAGGSVRSCEKSQDSLRLTRELVC